MCDQAEKLRRRLQDVTIPVHGKTIAVVSGKGGVGKSNVALNFSLELLNRGKKVLLLDLDVGMGNIDILLGLSSEKTIVDLFTGHLSIHDIIESGPRGLAYIAAGSGLDHFLTLDAAEKESFFLQYEELITLYDYIVFDIGAGATEDSLSFVVASDECIVVTTPEPTSITDAYSMIKHIVIYRPDMPISVIMNRAKSAKSGEQALSRFQRVIKQFLNTEIQKLGILPDDKTVSDAVIRQIPFILLNEKSHISRAVKGIVDDYLMEKSNLSKKASASFVQRLKLLMLGR
ncbi:MinD/ParA family protein [Lentibacillus salicampi]